MNVRKLLLLTAITAGFGQQVKANVFVKRALGVLGASSLVGAGVGLNKAYDYLNQLSPAALEERWKMLEQLDFGAWKIKQSAQKNMVGASGLKLSLKDVDSAYDRYWCEMGQYYKLKAQAQKVKVFTQKVDEHFSRNF